MKVIISKKNVELIEKLVGDYKGVEIGGTLIGYKIESSYIITNIIYDDSTNIYLNKYTFVRKIDLLKDKMIKCINNNKNIDYIGEWHTHPNNRSTYSFRDKETMKNLIEDFTELLLLIHGVDGISIYLFNKNILKLELVIEER